MKRYLLMGLMLIGLLAVNCSCGPASPTKKQDNPDFISAESLVDHYHSGRKSYNGRLVQIHLKAKSYKPGRGVVEAHQCGAGYVLRFETTSHIPDDLSNLVVTGTVHGIVRDGVVRCEDLRITWFILVKDASVTMLSP